MTKESAQEQGGLSPLMLAGETEGLGDDSRDKE